MRDTTVDSHQSEPGAVGEGRFHPHRRHMRKSGDALVRPLGIHQGLEVSTSAAATAPPPFPRRARRRCARRRHRRATWWSRVKSARRKRLDNLPFQQGDASNLSDLPDERFDLVIPSSARCSLPSLRRRQGDGASDQAGRPHHHGELDPRRPHARRADPQVSSAYTPPPPEGFVSPMTWGDEGRSRIGSRRQAFPPRRSASNAQPGVSAQARSPSDLLASFRNLLWADHECFRRRSEERPCRGTVRGIG